MVYKVLKKEYNNLDKLYKNKEYTACLTGIEKMRIKMYVLLNNDGVLFSNKNTVLKSYNSKLNNLENKIKEIKGK